jgi:carbonic anhydrase/acetyltransferase-like protein (isoleucine patch superfamily)
MIIEHLAKVPKIHSDAWVAPDATVCGDVSIDAGSRIMHGARIVSEGGSIVIGKSCIIMENAVVRATAAHNCRIGDCVLIGPNAHVVGATIEDEVFIATGAAVFHASRLGRGSEVRIGAVVHLKTILPASETVPIGWIACGEPARLFSPGQHIELWKIQGPLNFPMTVYGVDRNSPRMMQEVTRRLSEQLLAHRDDRVLPQDEKDRE